MRIALEITGALAGSGYRRYVEMITNALAAEDKVNEYLLYGAFWKNPERVNLLDLPKQSNFKLALVKAPQKLLLPAEEYLGLRWQERQLNRMGADMIHGLCSWVPPLDRLPSLTTLAFSGVWPFKGWEGFYFNRLTERSAKQADKVLAISGLARDEALKAWNLDPKKIEVVYYGAPVGDFRPGDPAEAEKDPFFLFVGMTRPTKNTIVLFKAFVKFKQKHPDSPHRFVICGFKGDDQPIVERIVDEAGLRDAVTFAGPIEPSKIHEYYRKAMAYVSASITEGFHLPLIEAMACGLPCIVAKGTFGGRTESAQVEVVRDAGIHVEATPEDLCRGMEAVAFDGKLRAEMRRKGLERAKEFSWSTCARKTIAAYEDVYAKRRRPRAGGAPA